MVIERVEKKNEIKNKQIYSDIYEKRIDTRKVERRAELKIGHIRMGELRFDDPRDKDQALRDGVFFLKIPSWVNVGAADVFATQFYRGKMCPPYGHFRDMPAEEFGDPLLGFHQRINQIEQFLLERRFWKKYYPIEITDLGEKLTLLSRQLICSVLKHVGIPHFDWRKATGGCAEASGAYHLTFNHYRPTVPDQGLNSHKDDGFLTILRTTTPGLEINRENCWEAVDVDPACFIINFGLSMELLTSQCQRPVAAIMHRVAPQAADRSSYGHFSSSNCIPGKDEGIFRYIPGANLHRICGSRELIDMNDYEIYQGTKISED